MKMLFLAVAIMVVVVLAFALIERMRLTRLRKAAAARSTSRDVKQLVAPLRRPAVLISLTDTPSTSYFGGHPPLHKGFTWPEWKGRPLAFLACIDLAALGNSVEWLPREGWLLFFYDLKESPWGFAQDRGAWRVLFVKDQPATLAEAPFPSHAWNTKWEIKRHYMRFHPVQIPPTIEEEAVSRLNLSEIEQEDLDALRINEQPEDANHQIGGWPDPVQSPEMPLECQFASSGQENQNPPTPGQPGFKELRAASKEWELLLQMHTDDDLDLMWGDGGSIYFWVRTEEARQGTFDNVWLILQSH